MRHLDAEHYADTRIDSERNSNPNHLLSLHVPRCDRGHRNQLSIQGLLRGDQRPVVRQ
jgi:hypothetical protein